jgi:hypothetical protein
MIELGRNTDGNQLYAKQIRKGDKYGLNNCIIHDEGDPLIEFYVMGDNGPSFVSRCYRATLMGECAWSIRSNRTGITGLCLCGGTKLSATAAQVGTACSVSEATSH